MGRSIWIALVLCVAATVPSARPAVAMSCAELFEMIGRTYVPDAPNNHAESFSGESVVNCPADQALQLVVDYTATRDATAIQNVDQLIGTWVSDDVLAIYAGIFIPVYEVLVIEPSTDGTGVEVTQQLIRAYDPKTWFEDPSSLVGVVDVEAAGRIATYGSHLLELTKPGQLAPRRVRYFDFPIESDRNTALAMKRRYMTFLQSTPIRVRTNGDRLVFEIFDRLSPGGERVMTFRKRAAGLPEISMLIAWLGEQRMAHFHCFLEAMDRPSKAFTDALGDVTPAEFFVAMRQANALAEENERLMVNLNATDLGEEARKTLTEKVKANLAAIRTMFDGPALKVLVTQAASGAPFGCRSFY